MKKYISIILMIGALILSSFFSPATVLADSLNDDIDNTYIEINETTEDIDMLDETMKLEPNKLVFTPNSKFIEFLEETNREATVTQTDKGIRILVYNHSGDPTGHPIPPLKMTVPSGWQIMYSIEAINPSPQTVSEGIVNEKNFIYYVLVEKTGDVVYTENEILDWYLSMDIDSESITTTAPPIIPTESTTTTVITTEPNKLVFTPNSKFIEFLEETNREATVTQTDKGIRILVYNHSGDPTGHPIPPLKMTVPSGWKITYSIEAVDPSPQTVSEGIVNEKNFIYYVLVEKTGDAIYTENEILDWYLSMDIGSESITTTAPPIIPTESTTTTVTTTEVKPNTEQTTEPPTTGAGGSVTTETSTVPPTTTTGTETTLPQTGYSKWYQALIAAAMGMIGVGSTAIMKSGIFRKKENNS